MDFILEFRTKADKRSQVITVTKSDEFYSALEYKKFVSDATKIPVTEIIVIGVNGVKAEGKAVV